MPVFELARWHVDYLCDPFNWLFGLCFDLDGCYLPEAGGRHKTAVVSLGPLVLVFAYRV